MVLKTVSSMKESNTMFIDLKKKPTYNVIIKTFNSNMPLIFFKKEEEKEKQDKIVNAIETEIKAIESLEIEMV